MSKRVKKKVGCIYTGESYGDKLTQLGVSSTFRSTPTTTTKKYQAKKKVVVVWESS